MNRKIYVNDRIIQRQMHTKADAFKGRRFTWM